PLEEMIQRPDARPLSDRVGQRDELEEHVRDEHVVGVRAVVDAVDDDRPFGCDLIEIADRCPLDHGTVEEVHDRAGDGRAETVVGQQVELRNDLAQIGPGDLRRLIGRDAILARIALDRMDDLAMAEHLELDVGVLTLELESIDADPARPLQPPRMALAEHQKDDGQNRDRTEPEDDSQHGRVFDSSPGYGARRRATGGDPGAGEHFDSLSPAGRARRGGIARRCAAAADRARAVGRAAAAHHRCGRKHLRDRFWGFVDLVSDPLHVAAALDAHTYLTKTRGARYLPAARVAAEGIYSLTSHEGHTHFAFNAALRDERDVDVESSGDFIVMAANPDPAAWGLAEVPPLQEELFPEYEVHVEVPRPLFADRFRGRRYIPLERDMLDIPGVELIFLGAHPER